MRIVVVGIFLMAAATVAGYFGFADVMANGFKALTLILGVLFMASWLVGGIRVSSPRPASPRLTPRVRRTAS